MRTLGIDLSTDPKKTWACEIDWSEAPPRVVALDQLASLPAPATVRPGAAPGQPSTSTAGAPQSALIRSEASLIAGLVERIVAFEPGEGRVVGIDAPLGWPSAFVEAITDWDDGDLRGFRKGAELRLRATDRFVHAVTGITPMSVSTDRMGSTSMLLAEVLSRAATKLDRGRFDRASALDGIAEVHPAAALRLWTHSGGEPFSPGGYRAAMRRSVYLSPRATILGQLVASGIEVGSEHGEAMLDSGDAVDAFLCALMARAVATGETLTPSDTVDLQDIVPKHAAGPRGETIERTTARLDLARALQAEAQRTADAEGWIHLPRRADLATALALTPGSAAWAPDPAPALAIEAGDAYARWSNGDGRSNPAEPDEYGPVARFVGEGDAHHAAGDAGGDELLVARLIGPGERG